MNRPILLQHRLRQIERPFGWIPLRLLRDGYWAQLSAHAKILYCLLCIVSDRRGISFYGDVRLQQLTGFDQHDLCHARDELLQRDLLAIGDDDNTVQLLSLPHTRPERPLVHQARPLRPSPAHAVPAATEPSTELQLQAVRTLISTLTPDKRQNTSRSHDHVTKKHRP